MNRDPTHKMDSQYGINHNDSDIVKHFCFSLTKVFNNIVYIMMKALL
ncbi:MAG: hypothetical protein Barrevirus1_58 [Barrevirus sp.]|uniref:Uncharacterized protein n=1 Tax=Barrevirus sp. TaxID=2487763 RepID=A0A3G4ZPL6_9VIRU|nr:MAG: hypothetical protein Barrevirus1_58 [Barrevirus sp.]